MAEQLDQAAPPPPPPAPGAGGYLGRAMAWSDDVRARWSAALGWSP